MNLKAIRYNIRMLESRSLDVDRLHYAVDYGSYISEDKEFAKVFNHLLLDHLHPSGKHSYEARLLKRLKWRRDVMTNKAGTLDKEKARRVDIASLWNFEKVKNKRGGFTSLCIFHSEKTPSLSVFTGKDGIQRYCCFSCGAKGDAISLVQEKYNFSFVSAVKFINGRK